MTRACAYFSLACALSGFLGIRAEAGPNSTATLIDLDPGALGSDSQALGVNSNGDTVGSVLGIDSNQHAFVYTAGSLSLLGGGGSTSVAYGINDSGIVVGTLNNQAFSFANGQATFLTALPGAGTSVAVAINDSNEIVGTATMAGGTGTLAFMADSTQVSPMGVLPGQIGSLALSINGNGQIVGASGGQAFFTIQQNRPGSPLQLINLGAYLFPGKASYATGINDHRVVCGTVTDGTTSQGWTYSKGISKIVPPLPGASVTVANAISSGGVVVGSSGGRAYSFSGNTTTDLNTKITAGSAFLSLDTATAINDKGLIVGTGTTVGGHKHGFILQP